MELPSCRFLVVGLRRQGWNGVYLIGSVSEVIEGLGSENNPHLLKIKHLLVDHGLTFRGGGVVPRLSLSSVRHLQDKSLGGGGGGVRG